MDYLKRLDEMHDEPFGIACIEILKNKLREYNSLLFEATVATEDKKDIYLDQLPDCDHEVQRDFFNKVDAEYDMKKVGFMEGIFAHHMALKLGRLYKKETQKHIKQKSDDLFKIMDARDMPEGMKEILKDIIRRREGD